MSKYNSSALWRLFSNEDPVNKATRLRRAKNANESYRRRGIALPFTRNRNRLRLRGRKLSTRRNSPNRNNNTNSALARMMNALRLNNGASAKKEALATLQKVANVKVEEEALRKIKKVEKELNKELNKEKSAGNLEKKEAIKLERAKKKAETARKRAEALIRKAQEALEQQMKKKELLEEAEKNPNLNASAIELILAPKEGTRKSTRIAARKKKANNNNS
jgi:hypothetical protein